MICVQNYQEFIFRINVGRNPKEDEFEILGGDGYTFIPYKEDTPIISGVSKHSLYYNLLKSLNGVLKLKDVEQFIDVKYKYEGEKLESQIALAKVNENYLLPLMSSFTGSLASDLSDNIDSEDEVIIAIEDEACEFRGDLGEEGGFICDNENSTEFNREFLIESYDGLVEDNMRYDAAFRDCEVECVEQVFANEASGLFA